MVTFAPSNPTRQSPQRTSLGYDFALLGLKAREARVDVIRNAAEQTAAKIPDEAEGSERVFMLAELATATYRLLDPRRRTKPLERIQLSIVSEAEPVLATVAKKPLVRGPIKRKVVPVVAAETVDQAGVLAQPPSKIGFHKVSYSCDAANSRKLEPNKRLGVIALSVLSTLIASSAAISWLLFS